MVEMMRGVRAGGGTAPGASAGGHPLAGKTGTVNNHTDVWFIGYTPTYVTGVWMGNPLRKESLGAGMTGGHGAVPYFNAFMIPFMKDKPRDNFPSPPPMPSEIKTLKRTAQTRGTRKTRGSRPLRDAKPVLSSHRGTKDRPECPHPDDPHRCR